MKAVGCPGDAGVMRKRKALGRETRETSRKRTRRGEKHPSWLEPNFQTKPGRRTGTGQTYPGLPGIPAEPARFFQPQNFQHFPALPPCQPSPSHAACRGSGPSPRDTYGCAPTRYGTYERAPAGTGHVPGDRCRKRRGWAAPTLKRCKSTNPADLRSQSIFLLEFAPDEEETDTAAVNYMKQDDRSEWSCTCRRSAPKVYSWV